MGPELSNHPDERYPPLALIAVAVCALIACTAVFLSVLVVPAAILVLFVVGFSASDRVGYAGGPAVDAPPTPRLPGA